MHCIYRLISATLVLVLGAGSLPYLTCSPAVCAANVECAAVHCSCCGPNCPWQKTSQNSKKQGTGCNREECPRIAASKSITIAQPQAFAALMFRNDEAQRFVSAYFATNNVPVYSIASLSPPTLLSLGCALTV